MNIKLIALSLLVITITVHAADEKKNRKKTLEQLAIASYAAAAQKRMDKVPLPYTDNHFIAHGEIFSNGEISPTAIIERGLPTTGTRLTGIAIVMLTEIPEESDDSLGKILKTAHPTSFVKKFVNAYQDKRPVSEPCKFCRLIENPTLPIGHMMQLKLLSKGHPLTICPGCNGTKEIVDFVRFAPYSFGLIKKISPHQVYACYQLTNLDYYAGAREISKLLAKPALMIKEPKKEAKS
ncbi:MAG TPA: hypothetical protein VFF04_06570 [Candidatus Babeliales bacterium]|nr:hypothetical protein [Candidatus Babeliales bacterium]